MKAKNYYPVLLMALVAGMLSSCQKNASTSASSTTSTTAAITKTVSTSTVLSTGSIAISTTTTLATTTPFAVTDSIYLTNCYPKNGKKDTVAFSSLSSAITTYLTTNYSGYTAVKAFSVSDSTKTIIDYIVVIKYNGNLVGLKFTAAGVFVSVLEQMAGADLGGGGPGCHAGGPFADRGGFKIDTIALSAIPTVVKTAFTTAYPTDTLLHASIAPDGSYVLISKDKSLYATDISATGTVVNHVIVPGAPATHTAVLQANLPTAISTYLTTTYPGYVFNKAFSVSSKTAVLGYAVFITSNSTNYVVIFDATGTFLKAVVLH